MVTLYDLVVQDVSTLNPFIYFHDCRKLRRRLKVCMAAYLGRVTGQGRLSAERISAARAPRDSKIGKF